jgi:hypothetical protein
MDLMKILGEITVGNRFRCEWKTKCRGKSQSMRAVPMEIQKEV